MSSTGGVSSTSSRNTRAARRRLNPSQDQPSSLDLFAESPAHVTTPLAEEPATTIPSGLHTSELNAGLSDPLVYSELSATDDAYTTTIGLNVSRDNQESTTGTDAPQVVIWGTNVNVPQVMDKFKNFLQTYIVPSENELHGDVNVNLHSGQTVDFAQPYYVQKIDDMAFSGSNILEVDCEHLKQFSSSIYQQLVYYPLEVIPAMDSAALELYQERCRDSRPDRMIQVRYFNCDRSRALRHLNPDDLDQMVSVCGMIIRLSSLIPEMLRAHFSCSICGHALEVLCERGRVQEPQFCHNCHAAYTYHLVHNRCSFVDRQMIKLQESPEDMPPGQTPHTVVLYITGDMVDCVQPGDRVTITGVYRAQGLRVNPFQRTLKAVYKTYVDALHFQRQQTNRLRTAEDCSNLTHERIAEVMELSRKPDLYERLSSAIAPTIYENEDVKKGILLQLFGGCSKDFAAVGRGNCRAEINILLCGDPGTSKSQLLQYVYNLVPRGQYTSGKGSSAVGLTAFITKDPETRQLTLQTGALVLADNGVCCIDEFDKMSDSTRAILHEVMEQQTLSMAKAGILCQLNARTSILAAANPIHSKWDAQKTIIDNINLPHTLLSRFDLIFLILDPQDEIYDARLARHLVSLYYKGTDEEPEESLTRDLLRDYISYAKNSFTPRITDEAGQFLVQEYVQMRQLGAGRGQVTAYPRQLESLIRLSEAHARMRLSSEVTVDDCREARRLHREALKQTAIDPSTGYIDVNILTTGMSSSTRKRREEVARAIWAIIDERGRVLTFNFQRILEEVRQRSERMITRDLFEDGLNVLKNENKIEWAGNTIRKR